MNSKPVKAAWAPSSPVAYQVNCNCPLARTVEPGVTLCDSLHSCALLEALDDAMFTAIGGSAASLAEARRLWIDACAALSPELLHESRAQYLRYANDVTREYQSDQVRHPDEMLAAVEIIELLTKWGAT